MDGAGGTSQAGSTLHGFQRPRAKESEPTSSLALFPPTKWHNDRFCSVQLKFQAQRNSSSALSSPSVVAHAIPKPTSTDFTHASDWFEELQCSLLVGGRRWKP